MADDELTDEALVDEAASDFVSIPIAVVGPRVRHRLIGTRVEQDRAARKATSNGVPVKYLTPDSVQADRDRVRMATEGVPVVVHDESPQVVATSELRWGRSLRDVPLDKMVQVSERHSARHVDMFTARVTFGAPRGMVRLTCVDGTKRDLPGHAKCRILDTDDFIKELK